MRRGRIALIVLGLIVALLLVNTWLVERETEPAKADIGRILELPRATCRSARTATAATRRSS